MSAVTSPIRPWHSLMTKVPYIPLLAFLLISLPLTAISIYLLPYFEYALPKFIWMVVLVLAVLLFQIRASMEHPSNKFLNSLTSYPITFVTLPAFFAGTLVFSRYPAIAQSVSFAFLLLISILYGLYFYLSHHQEGRVYALLTRRGSSLVQYLLAFAFVMIAVWALPNPAQASSSGPAASWQAQLSAAQAKIAEHYPNTFLEHVEASAIGTNWPDASSALLVRFYFGTSTNDRYMVTLYDTNPSGTVRLESASVTGSTRVNPIRADAVAVLQPLWATIKLSPRDALIAIPPHLGPPGEGAPTVSISGAVKVRETDQPVWQVSYSTPTNIGQNDYFINAVTGVEIGY